MSDTEEGASWQVRAGVGVAGILLVAGVVWWFLPGASPRLHAKGGVGEIEVPTAPARRKVIQFAAVEEDEEIPLEEDPNIPVVTPHCKLLVTLERNKVPQFSVLDTLRDQSMVFSEEDLGCLTAAGVSPAILDLAEQRIDYNKLRGIKGTPGENLTRQHQTFRDHPANKK